jgi:voltage-gated potassium channel Kch
MQSKIKRIVSRVSLMQRLLWLLQKRLFWQLTIGVHGLILLTAALLYLLEHGINPNLHSFHDAVYWSVSTATSVGYGDITASTILGKWLSIGLMVLGTLFSALYTALFAAALMKPEIDLIEREILEEDRKVETLSRKVDTLNDRPID